MGRATVVLLLILAAGRTLPVEAQGLLPRTLDGSRSHVTLRLSGMGNDSLAQQRYLPPGDYWKATGKRDHRWEGMAIGGIVFGIAGAWLAHGLCNLEPAEGSCFGQTLAGGLVGGALGLGVGALVGALIPKGL